MSDEILNELEKGYKTDEQLNENLETVQEPYFKKGKRLSFENRLCIPGGEIRETIMHDNHESLLGGHRRDNKTLTLIRRHFFWPTMKRDIKNYVQSCKKCQESKA